MAIFSSNSNRPRYFDRQQLSAADLAAPAPQQPVASQQFWGLAVVHGVAGLTNVNTVHNLYTLALSLAASAVLLRAAHTPYNQETHAP